MAITKYPPNTIWLGGEMKVVNDVAAGGIFSPGHLIERYNSSGTPLLRKHSGAAGAAAKMFALNQSMLNKGVDDAYAVGDLVEYGIFSPGSTVWALIGVLTVIQGSLLESAGNGTLRLVTAGFPIAQAIEGKVGASGETRVRVEIL